jgi:CRISPR type I-D-associated protein Csc1
MKSQLKNSSTVYRCHINTHDFFSLTRHGFYDTATSEYIGNYGIMYALNRNVSSTQRNVSGTKPFYNEDIPKFRIYATPAKPAENKRIFTPNGSSFKWGYTGRIMLTYNSVNTISNETSYVRDDPRSKTNFPSVGRKEKDYPLTSYEFYAIGGKPERLVRLGKKMTAVRIMSEPLTVKQCKDSQFTPTHPINVSDTSSEIYEGKLYRQFPPLILDAKMKGKHCICTDRWDKEHVVALPRSDLYQGVLFPNIDVSS